MLKPKLDSNLSKFITMVISCAIGLSLIVLIYSVLKEGEADKFRKILQNPHTVTAIVTDKRSYKGKGIDVEYIVNGKQYEYKTGINNQTYSNYQIGDTISVTICEDDPSLALLTLEINQAKLKRFLGKDAKEYWERYRENYIKNNQ